jgi:hypothetical protein
MHNKSLGSVLPSEKAREVIERLGLCEKAEARMVAIFMAAFKQKKKLDEIETACKKQFDNTWGFQSVQVGDPDSPGFGTKNREAIAQICSDLGIPIPEYQGGTDEPAVAQDQPIEVETPDPQPVDAEKKNWILDGPMVIVTEKGSVYNAGAVNEFNKKRIVTKKGKQPCIDCIIISLEPGKQMIFEHRLGADPKKRETTSAIKSITPG